MSAVARQSVDVFEAELFASEGHQAVRLPDALRVEGKSVRLRVVPEGLLIEGKVLPLQRTAEDLKAMWADIDSLGADPIFPNGRDQGNVEPEELFE